MKTVAIIPTYQTAPYIKDVITDTKNYLNDILVVDDGSTDGSGDIASDCGVKVITHETNNGKGAALKTGFNYAIKHGYDAVITLDADGQHKAKYIPDFMNMYAKTRAGLIIGSRKSDKADMSFPRRCSNFLTSHMLSFLLCAYIEDSQSGYRLITTDLLKQVELKSDRYELETEIIIRAITHGFKTAFVPIKVVYGANFPSSISHFADTFRWVKMVLEEI
ncbi:MAG: glycosyltransferase family 2 protein [candidate division Zixibacteria bacterium]|nr:glycosyltransferase family 2 protein [candidate division Zixibacteria bacterium]